MFNFLKDNFLANKPALIRVIDPDLNLNPDALDQIPVSKYIQIRMLPELKLQELKLQKVQVFLLQQLSFTQNLYPLAEVDYLHYLRMKSLQNMMTIHYQNHILHQIIWQL